MSEPITQLDAQETKVQKAQVAREGYIHRALVAFDIAFNVIVLRGQEDETISSHSARAALEGKTWGKWMSAFLNLFQKDHGAKAIAGDLQRAENIEQIEKQSGGITE